MELKNNKEKIISNEDMTSTAYEILKNKILYMVHTEKVSAANIANELGISIRTVYNYINQLKKEGELPQTFSFKPVSSKDEIKKNLLALILQKKQSAQQIADTLDISVTTVYKYVNNFKKSGKLPQTFSFSSPYQEKLENEILSLVENNKISAKEISSKLEIALPTVYGYIERLKESGKLSQDFSFTPKATSKKVKLHKASLAKEELNKKILSYVSTGKYRATDIASKLAVDASTVYSCVRALKKAGELPGDFSFKTSYTGKETEDKILHLILNKKLTAQEIATELRFTPSTIYEHANNLKKQGKLPDDFSFERSTAKDELKEQIYNLSSEGNIMAKDVAKELGVTFRTVLKYIRELKSEERIPQDFSFRRPPSREKVKDEICFLALKEHLSPKEISSSVGISFSTVYQYINELKAEDRIPREFQFSKNSSEKLKDKIYSLAIIEEKRAKDIAVELGITHPTIRFYIEELKKEGTISQDFSFKRGKNKNNN